MASARYGAVPSVARRLTVVDRSISAYNRCLGVVMTHWTLALMLSTSAYADDAACTLPAFAAVPSCESTCPDYCDDPAYGGAIACKSCGPDWCASEDSAAAIACFGTCPVYCGVSTHADDLACAGCLPAYCNTGGAVTASLACTLVSDPSVDVAAPLPAVQVFGATPAPEEAEVDVVRWGGSGGSVPRAALNPKVEQRLDPSACKDAKYQAHPVCEGSCPSYCSNVVHLDAPACWGCEPAYCAIPAYRGAPSCTTAPTP